MPRHVHFDSSAKTSPGRGGSGGKPRRTRARRARAGLRPDLEVLEGRIVLTLPAAANASLTLPVNGVLQVIDASNFNLSRINNNVFEGGLETLLANSTGSTAHGSISIDDFGSFTYEPDGNFTGTDSFQYVLKDPQTGETSTPGTITIVVAPFLTPSGTQTVAAGSTLSIQANAVDSTGQNPTITYSIGVGIQPGMSINTNTGAFTWAIPASQAPGTYTFAILASDSAIGFDPYNIGDEAVKVIVTAPPAPALASIAPQTIAAGNILSLSARASDPNNASATFTYRLGAGDPSGTAIDPASGAFSWSVPSSLTPGNYPITILADETGTSPVATATTTFTVTVTAASLTSPLVIDDAGTAYTKTAGWTSVPGRGGYGNEYQFASPGNGTTTATWQASGLSAGAYDVQVTWASFLNRPTNAHYQIYDGNTRIGQVFLNQQLAPTGPVILGTTFQDLGTFAVSSGTLKVVLGNDANGYVIADAVRIVPSTTAPTVVDDGGGGDFSETGPWTSALNTGGYDGSYSFVAPGTGSSAASWQVPALAAGTYDVQLTWVPYTNRASNAHYRIYDGSTLLKDVYINQQLNPSGPTVGGVTFQDLGPFTVTTGTLKVVLGNDANGYVIADSVRVVPTATPAPVIDDGQAGFSQVGTWTQSPNNGGIDGDYLFASPGDGSTTATWQTTGLTAGSYDVQVTWVPFANRASNAHYRIYNGSTLLKDVYINQQVAPSGPTYNGTVFQDLGTFAVSSGTLKVVLGNDANGYVIADAARVVPTPVPTPVIDSGQPGYAETGSWSGVVARGGFDGDYRFAAPNVANTSATWQATGLASGAYDVQVTWVAASNRADNAHYQIYDGTTLLRDLNVNQKLAPSGPSYGGTTFQDLGPFSVTSGTLRVVLGTDADGYVIADAVRIIPQQPTATVVSHLDASYGESVPFSTAGPGGSGGYYDYAPAGTGSMTATWPVPNLAPGTYDVEVTWVPFSNRADNAHYRIYDGSTLVKDVRVNQKAAPSGPTANGLTFQSLGAVTTTSGSLRVVLSNDADGYIVADTVRVVPLPSSSWVVDGNESGYAETTGWTGVFGSGYDGDYRYVASSSSGVTAASTWVVPGLAAGTYEVDVTWVPYANRSAAAHYEILDGSTVLKDVFVNQKNAPSGPTAGGVVFQSLGIFPVTSGSLKVALLNDGTGYVIADAVRIAKVGS